MSGPARRSRIALVVAVALVAGQLASGSAALAPSTAAATPTLAQLVGQKLVVRMDGTIPTASLLGRIRRGEIGGVILFGANITTRTALIALTHRLHHAAIDGGQPPLLIAVDQEGGRVKRIPWAPPTLSPPAMGSLDSTATAHRQGSQTGVALRALGIDVDVAPVADVPASTSSFLYRQHRTWSFSASRTSLLANAFSAGLRSAGVVPSMKHFPGLGLATLNTDLHLVSIRASRTALAPGLLPYRVAIAAGAPLIMLSNATYSAYDPYAAAGWSPAINTTLLRTRLGFRGVTITDGLDGTAASRGLTTAHVAYRAARAGTDMLLVTGSELTSRGVYAALLAAARAGSIPLALLRASWTRIMALKAGR
ncbi:MAG TPA: glycoside hydrolase family 3 N-terminal domain-containing protein [Patescibacteria group bacterium]|nr:glycoside hydrolase family 3 N-terminal domain-containing protein [Patescibacteria group bacterium]